MDRDAEKKASAHKALEFVEEGMHIGLGTGSTAALFIDALIEKCSQGLTVHAVATSIESEKRAQAGGIPLLDINAIKELDITVDGADEFDPKKRLIKGGGGAFLREKIIAAMSKEMIVIVDSSKKVEQLGSRPLPLEVIPFGAEATHSHLEKLGYTGSWRESSPGVKTLTDNNNWIFDVAFASPLSDPETTHLKILTIPGIVETGLFINLASRIIIGNADGTTTVQQ